MVGTNSSSAIMKLYALFTLHETGWGTRAGVGDRKSTLYTSPALPPDRRKLCTYLQPLLQWQPQKERRTWAPSHFTKIDLTLPCINVVSTAVFSIRTAKTLPTGTRWSWHIRLRRWPEWT